MDNMNEENELLKKCFNWVNLRPMYVRKMILLKVIKLI